MVWFHFCTANHNQMGRASLNDQAEMFEAGLLDLGHRVTFSDHTVEPAAINIFWECFSPAAVKRMAALTVPYGIIATEIPDGTGFNWRREKKWLTRYEGFKTVAARAAFIWSAYEAAMPFYESFCPSVFVDFGFSERLIPSYSHQVPIHDFSFYGLSTPYREHAIDKIRRHANVQWPKTFLTPQQVGELIGQSKIGINFKQSEGWPVPSGTKLMRLMMAKRGVASEYVPVATRQGEIAGICPPDVDFADYALELLHGDYKARADAVFERYRAELPMAAILERAIDHTIPAVMPLLSSHAPPVFIKNDNYSRFMPLPLRSRLVRVVRSAQKMAKGLIP